MPRAGRYYSLDLSEDNFWPIEIRQGKVDTTFHTGEVYAIGLVVNGTPKQHRSGA